MSCRDGEPCREAGKRQRALWVLVLMALIFAGLSFFSFTSGRQQVLPAEVTYAGHDAAAGRKVFQAWNCMGCHTIVGNGAYFGPDLTNIYRHTGPAWLTAFLPSAGGWPTAAAVRVQLKTPVIAAALDADAMATDFPTYLQQFPGAAERIERRGGQHSYMPNLALSKVEIEQLIAFFKYTSAMHNEGWPPQPKIDGLQFIGAASAQAQAQASESKTQPATMAANAEADEFNTALTAAMASSSAPDLAQLGKALVRDNGCLACHSTGQARVVGPGWAGLSGAMVELASGERIPVDDAYLARKIRDPAAQPVAGYPTGIMPAFGEILSDTEVAAIVAYLQTL